MKILLILLSILIIPGAFLGLIDSAVLLFYASHVFYPLIIGFIVSLILYYAYLRDHSAFTIFEHELAHAIVALMFFRRVKRFVSTSSGGYVDHSGGFGGKFGNLMISLAPYFLPTFTILLCLLRPLIPGNWFPWYDGVIGLTLGYHVVSTFDEIIENYSKRTFFLAGTTRSTQTDLGKVGLITSIFLIAALTLLLNSIIFYMLTGGYPAVGDYFALILREGKELCLLTYYRLLLPIVNYISSLLV